MNETLETRTSGPVALSSTAAQDSRNNYSSPSIRFIVGRDAILAYARRLQEFAEKCEQPGSVQWLGYFLSGTGQHWKRPWMLLFLHPGTDDAAITSETILGCAMYYELNVGPVGSGIFFTDDWYGMRSLVAPEGQRGRIAALATEALFARGAHLVLTTYASPDPAREQGMGPILGPHRLWADGVREGSQQRLSLEPTWDALLAKLGKKTRDNLRYYRKRLGAEVGCEFVPDALSTMSQDDYMALNRQSLNPVPTTECRRRYRALHDDPDSFLVGVRTTNGEWLSVLGGWRQDGVTVMHHQMNRSGYDRYSIGHVMRSFFLQDEVERGTGVVVFYHGTNHSMAHVFDVERMRDLIAVRSGSLRVRLLRMLAPRLAGQKRYTESTHFGGSIRFLSAMLSEPMLRWHPSGEEAVPTRALAV